MVIKLDNLLPDIYDYLETANNSKTVSAKGLDDIVLKVRPP